ncbi:NAD-dependent epimerase/dehydratase family protein [Blastococcus deserti]|uniref:NAD-dependent epimerase/dehydratase family protein n=1 Tax=Blastococcus deserti TaxID=2259033 RepID=A0ABW4XCA3_9ACTN
MTRLLITGGAGFIGSNLAAAAVAGDGVQSVRVLDDFSTGSRRNLQGLDVEVVKGSLLEPDTLDRALRDVDAVVHLGAIPSVPRSIADPVASHAANATGTLMLLEGCRVNGVSYVVAASSSSVYGANPALPKHEREWVRPLSPYAVSKLATEQYLLAYQSSFGLDTLPFRFFNVYGPGQAAGHAYAAVIPAFVDAVLSGRPLTVNGTGEQSRDFTYVGTVCDILLDAVARRVVSPEPVNLAFGCRTTLLELIGEIQQVTGRPAVVTHGPPRAGDVPHSQADNTALRTLFPDVVPTDLSVGLERTVSWFRTGMPR